MTDYRKLYAETFGITWDHKEMEVHHIDRDRTNNDIENLILLPSHLHDYLHTAFYGARVIFNDWRYTADSLLESIARSFFVGSMDMRYELLTDALRAIEACRKWGLLKYYGYRDNEGNVIREINPNTMSWIG